MEPSASNKILSFFSHPAVGVLGTLASLIGLVLTIYFYNASIRSRDFTYYFHPLRTNVVTLDNGSRLQVRYDGQDIKGSVTAMQFAVWNAGDEPIKEEDILERVTIKAESSVRILDAKIRQESRTVSGFHIDDSKKSDRELFFDWKILEKNDGAAIQILFEGDPNARFNISGIIAGQRIFSERKSGNGFKSPEEELKIQKKIRLILTVFIVITSATIFSMTYYFYRKRSRKIPLFFSIQFVVMIVMMIYLILELLRRPTPFDF